MKMYHTRELRMHAYDTSYNLGVIHIAREKLREKLEKYFLSGSMGL